MNDVVRMKYLKVALVATGLSFVAGIPLLMLVWPAGWMWHTGHSDYAYMIIGVYATLGLFLILAARDPQSNRSLIGFTVWSSVVHGAIMAVESFANPMNHGHLMGDVPALFIVAVVLGVLTPRNSGTR